MRSNPQPNPEKQRWRFWGTKTVAKRFLQDCWGKGLKYHPFPQTPFLLRLTKRLLRNRKLCPKILCYHPKGPGPTRFQNNPEDRDIGAHKTLSRHWGPSSARGMTREETSCG